MHNWTPMSTHNLINWLVQLVLSPVCPYRSYWTVCILLEVERKTIRTFVGMVVALGWCPIAQNATWALVSGFINKRRILAKFLCLQLLRSTFSHTNNRNFCRFVHLNGAFHGPVVLPLQQTWPFFKQISLFCCLSPDLCKYFVEITFALLFGLNSYFSLKFSFSFALSTNQIVFLGARDGWLPINTECLA